MMTSGYRSYTTDLSSQDFRSMSESPTAGNKTWNSFSRKDLEHVERYDYATSLVVVVVGFCGSVENLSVIWLLAFCVKRNPVSLYKLHLACADFTCLLSNSVLFMLSFFNHTSNAFSVFTRAVRNASFVVAVCLLLVLNAERCVYVLCPFWYRCHRPVHLSTILCALIWGLAFCTGILDFLWHHSEVSCHRINLFYCVIIFFTSLGLCVSGLTLLIQVQCCSWRRQPTWFYATTLLRMLVFLLLGLPAGVGFTVCLLLPSLPYKRILLSVSHLLLVLNSVMNPIIYFFVGRHR